jgi:hypothetical protein
MSLLFDIYTSLSHWRHPFLYYIRSLGATRPQLALAVRPLHIPTSDLPFVRLLTGTYWFLIGRSSAHFETEGVLLGIYLYPLDGGLCIGPFLQSRLLYLKHSPILLHNSFDYPLS